MGARALQEFAKAKRAEFNEGKSKVSADVAKKKKQQETKDAIEKSTKVNKQRLEKMQKQHEVLGRIADDSKQKMRDEIVGAKKVDFLKNLIAQGLLMLLEDNVEIICRKCDESEFQAAFEDAANLYRTTIVHQTSQPKFTNLSLSATSLPDDSLGGVILSCKDGAI